MLGRTKIIKRTVNKEYAIAVLSFGEKRGNDSQGSQGDDLRSYPKMRISVINGISSRLSASSSY